MKVLFAVSDDSISNAVITRYQQKYKEIITSKNVYYFNAIIAELQNNKTYDAIVIGEDLEPMANANYDKIDKFLFEKLDNISDEASKIDGEDMSIILICADRRDKSDTLLNKLFSLGIYNALIGKDRSVDDVCVLMKKPRSKKEAKLYYKIVDSVDNIEYTNAGLVNGVNETEIQNILNHYAKIGNDERKIVSSFDSIARQYDDTELRIIIKTLPMNVRAVLEQKSSKYQRLVSNGTVLSNGQYMPFQRPKNNVAQSIEITAVNTGTKPEVTGNVIIPQNIKINRPENINQQRQQQMQNQRMVDPRMQNPNQYGQMQNQNQMNQRMNNQPQQRPMTREEIMKRQEYLRRMQMQQMMMRQQQAQRGMSQQQMQQMQQQVNNMQRPVQRPNMNQNPNMQRPNMNQGMNNINPNNNIANNPSVNPNKEDDDLKKKYESPIDDEISKSLEIPELEKIEVKDFDKDVRDKKYQDKIEDIEESKEKENKEKEKVEDKKEENKEKEIKETKEIKQEKEIKKENNKEIKTDKKDIPEISDEILKLRREIEKEVNEEENVKKEQVKKKEAKKEKEQVEEIDEIEAIKRKIQQELEEEKQREQVKKKPVERRIINQSVNKEEKENKIKEKEEKENKENKEKEIKQEEQIKEIKEIKEEKQEANKQENKQEIKEVKQEEKKEEQKETINNKEQIEETNPINQTIKINNDFEKDLEMETEPELVEHKADKVVNNESKEQQSQEEKVEKTKDNNKNQYDDDLSELLSVSLDDEDREEDLYDNIALYNMDDDSNKVDVGDDDDKIAETLESEEQSIDNEEEIYKSLMNDFESYRTKQENVPEGQKITMSIDSNSDTEESLPEDVKTPLINKEVSPYKNANNFGTGVDYGNSNANNNVKNNVNNVNKVSLNTNQVNIENGNIPIHIGNNQVPNDNQNNNQIVQENNINMNDYNNMMNDNNNYNDYNNVIENPQHINMNMNVNNHNNTNNHINNNQQNVYNEIVNNNSEMIAFVGTSKNGTSFIVNNLALMLANNNVRVAILDLTENRNDYYLFTDNNPDLTNVAINSLKSLSEGYTDGLNVGNKFYVYTALPENSMFDDLNVQNIINTARNNYDIILLDCDFKTDDEYFKNADQICLIQTMDAFTIQPLTHFLHKKIEKNVIDSNKLKIVVNKYLKLKKLNERLIVEGLSKYNEPSMTLQKTLFDSQNIAYTVVPFEMQTYAKYLEAIVMCQVDLRGYSQYFLSSMEEVRDMLFEENKVRKTRKLGKMFR